MQALIITHLGLRLDPPGGRVLPSFDATPADAPLALFDQQIETLLKRHLSRRKKRPALVLAGETFDFSTPPLRPQSPREAILSLLAAHVRFVAALRLWIGAGGTIHLAPPPGAPWDEADTRALLQEILPGLRFRPPEGIHIEAT